MSLTELKNLCLWLGVKQSGTKADLIERTMSFLKKPEDQGAEVKKKSKCFIQINSSENMK